MRAHDATNSFETFRNGSHEDAVIRRRIKAEFSEMPGLKLTLPQASRLFHVEAARCERVLTSLVDTGQLAISGNTFVQRPTV